MLLVVPFVECGLPVLGVGGTHDEDGNRHCYLSRSGDPWGRLRGPMAFHGPHAPSMSCPPPCHVPLVSWRFPWPSHAPHAPLLPGGGRFVGARSMTRRTPLPLCPISVGPYNGQGKPRTVRGAHPPGA